MLGPVRHFDITVPRYKPMSPVLKRTRTSVIKLPLGWVTTQLNFWILANYITIKLFLISQQVMMKSPQYSTTESVEVYSPWRSHLRKLLKANQQNDTKSATIAFFSSPFFLLALSFSSFLFLHWCDFGAYQESAFWQLFTQMTADFVRLVFKNSARHTCVSSSYTHYFLSSLQSCFLVPTIDKPTRVRSTSTTLIDIFINNPDQVETSGNIIWYKWSFFAILYSEIYKGQNWAKKVDSAGFSRFSGDSFNADLSNVD